MRLPLLLTPLLAATLTAAAPPQPLTDWQEAWRHAKAGKTVSLRVERASLTRRYGRAVRLPALYVTLRDGDAVHEAGSVCFFQNRSMTFLIDLSPALSAMRSPPGRHARIVLSGDGVARYRQMKITLAD